MELIKRKIILNGLQISGDTIFPPNFEQPDYKIGIYLTQTYDNIGLYTDLLESDSKEIFSKTGQLGLIGGINGTGVYFVAAFPNSPPNPFIIVNNINEPDLISQISVGTELKIFDISNDELIDVVEVILIIGPSNNNMSYKLNKFISGLNQSEQVNVVVGSGNVNSVFLSDYIGTDNSGSGEINIKGIDNNFKLTDFLTNQNYILTGTTDSKLNEVKTFKLNDPFIVNKPDLGNKWVRNVDNENGRDFIEYTINPIDYKTFLDNKETIYKLPSQFNNDPILSGWNINNTSLLPSISEEMKIGLVQPPEIDSDIFINRNELSVFENHLKLNEIVGVQHLIEYQRKFYIINEE